METETVNGGYTEAMVILNSNAAKWVIRSRGSLLKAIFHFSEMIQMGKMTGDKNGCSVLHKPGKWRKRRGLFQCKPPPGGINGRKGNVRL